MRTPLTFAVALCLVPALHGQQRFRVTARTEPAAVAPGATVEAVVQVTIDASWHTYVPGHETGQGAVLDFQAPEGWAPVGDLGHTPPTLHQDPVLGRQWWLVGEVEFRQAFQVPAAAAPGPAAVSGALTLTVCDPFSCLPPQRVEWTAPVTVGTAAPVDAEAAWPAWRGPRQDGTAHPDADPPVRWSEDRNVRWKTEIPGRGSSTPIVWGDRVFVLTAVATDRPADPAPAEQDYMMTPPPTVVHEFVVLGVDRESGDILWEEVVREAVPHEGHHPTHDYAAGSPVTDGEVLIAPFGSQGVFCLDLEGNVLWQRDLGDMQTRRAWGEAVTPALVGDLVLVPFDHEGDSFLAGLDRSSGEVLWRVDRDEPTTWTTPVVVQHEGTRQLILNGTNRLRAYDLDTRQVLWECGGQTVNAIPSAVVSGGLAIAMSGYRGNLAVAVPLSARGDLTGTDAVAWSHDRGTPYVPSPLLVDGRVYFLNGNQGILTGLEAATGEVLVDRMRLEDLGTVYASPVAAAGRIYLVDREGTAVVLEEGPEPRVLAVNTLEDGFNASPAVVGDQLFLRGRSLYCIQATDAEQR